MTVSLSQIFITWLGFIKKRKKWGWGNKNRIFRRHSVHVDWKEFFFILYFLGCPLKTQDEFMNCSWWPQGVKHTHITLFSLLRATNMCVWMHVCGTDFISSSLWRVFSKKGLHFSSKLCGLQTIHNKNDFYNSLYIYNFLMPFISFYFKPYHYI